MMLKLTPDELQVLAEVITLVMEKIAFDEVAEYFCDKERVHIFLNEHQYPNLLSVNIKLMHALVIETAIKRDSEKSN